METGRPMISFGEALKSVLSNVQTIVETEYVSLEKSVGRVLAENVVCDRDVPPFNRSAMDGYAIKDEDVHNVLKIVEVLPAGSIASCKIEKGTCIKIMTGAVMPEGADRVVMVEYSEESEGYVRFNLSDNQLKSRNYALKGEDMKKGETAIPAGTVISPSHIPTMASLGKYSVKTFRKPVIGIIVTGDEVVEPWETPAGEKIRNANGWQLIAQIERAGCVPLYKGIVKDDLDFIKRIIEETAKECDMLLVTGGVSMGDYDLGGKAVRELGYNVIFDSVAVKPGKPSTFATRTSSLGEKEILFGMPGNPFSVFVIFEIMVRPAIEKMKGLKFPSDEMTMILEEDFSRKKGGREEWVPAKISQSGAINPIKYNGSGHFHILTKADVLFKIERGCIELKKGDKTSVRHI
jgi:molybdopterin molybdotransferase